MTQIRWDLLGAPVDVGAAVRGGLQVGRAFRQQQRQDDFQQSALAAYDPATGNVNAPAMRSAFVQARNVEGAMQFDASNAQAEQARQQQSRRQLTEVARLLDDSTDATSYAANRALAQRMNLDVSAIPEAYDPAWVDQQRRIVREFIDQPPELTSFMREAQAAGIQPGSPEFRQLMENRYAPQPRIVTGADGRPYILQSGPQAPAPTNEGVNPQTGERIRLNPQTNQWEPVQGGPQASSSAGGFSVISAPGAPRDGGSRVHMGYDMRNPTNPAWVAPMGFEVRNIRNGARQGITADVIFEDGTRVVGMHFREPPQARRGRPGEIIGYQGNTGNARTTPAHIHAEAWREGRRVDARPYFGNP